MVYAFGQQWRNGVNRQNTLKKYTSKSIFICFYYSRLYDYTPWLLFSNENFIYSLMRYNVIDTTALSATEARKLFEEHWDDIISTVENFLSSPNATQLASASASTSASSDQDTVQD